MKRFYDTNILLHVEDLDDIEGKVFENENDCVGHEVDLEVVKRLNELASSIFYYGMTADDLGRELYERREELKVISKFI